MQKKTNRPSVPGKRVASGKHAPAQAAGSERPPEGARRAQPTRTGRSRAERGPAPAVRVVPRAARKSHDLIAQAKGLLEKGAKPTRRQVIGAAAGVVAVGAVATGVGALVGRSSTDDAPGASTKSGDLSLLNVGTDAVFTTEECEYVESLDEVMRVRASASLPYGTMLWANDDDIAACLLPSDTSDPLTRIGLLALSSGDHATVLENAVGSNEGFQVYEVRASANGLAWVEADILDNVWRIYHTDIDGLRIGSPQLVYEGDSQYVMPSIAVAGGHTFWQLVPNVSGLGSAYTSSLMRAPIGAGPESAEVLLEAPGKMACGLSANPTGITCAPRAQASSTYYALTQVDAQSGEVIDELVLPASMRPTDVSYGNTGFTFAFEGIYSYGDGIANLGTYTPLEKPAYDLQTAYDDTVAGLLEDSRSGELSEAQLEEAAKRSLQAVADLYSAEQWFRFPRTPLAPPSWCGNWFMLRSTNVVAGVDLAGRRYFTIEADGTSQGYGEFLASQSSLNRAVTYSNVDYTTLEGDAIKECAVRIWEPV